MTLERRRPGPSVLLASVALALASCANDCSGEGKESAAGAAPGEAREGAAGDAGGSAGRWQPPAPTAQPLGDLPVVTPRWHITLPGPPAPVLVEHVAGPVIAPGPRAPETMILFASSAAGVVAVAADTGTVRWQRTDEQAPGAPVLGPADENTLWLPGRCAHARDELPARALPGDSGERLLGCVEIVDRAGVTRDRVWIHAQESALLVPAPRHSRALGRRDRNLIWVHGPDILSIAVPGGHVVERRRALPVHGKEPDAGEIAIEGWIDHGPFLIVTTTLGLAGFSACPARGVCSPAWHIPWPRATGVTGPVPAGSNLAWVRDHTLQAGDRGAIAWTAPGAYAYAPGSLSRTHEGTLLALRLDGDGIRPVRIDPAGGRVVEKGAPVAGVQVLAAARWEHGVGAVVRLDRSLRRDAVVAWDTALRIRWAWMLPVPARPRTEPIGLVALAPADSEPGLVVFHEGRFAALLPLSAP